MGTGSFCNKNINITQGNSDEQWPINVREMRSRYEVAGGSTRRNFSASAYFRDTAGNDFLNLPAVAVVNTTTPTRNVTVNYSFERFFADSKPAVGVQMRWVPGTAIPTYNWSTQQFAWPANTSTDAWDVDVSPATTISDTTQTRAYTFSITRLDFPLVGVTYRLWMYVDPGAGFAETDNGDNMIPTGITALRGN